MSTTNIETQLSSDYDEEISEISQPVNYEDSWHFPHPPREVQRGILRFISDHPEENNFMIHAPCGVGKSPVTVCLANADSGAIITPHKFLQDQYLRDWGDLSLIKGRNNYSCHESPGENCEEGHLMGCKSKHCPYSIARRDFVNSQIGVTNYDWLFKYIQMENAEIKHRWFLFDEAHEFEGKLIEQASLVVSRKACEHLLLPYDFFQTQKEGVRWFDQKFYPTLKQRHTEVTGIVDKMGDKADLVTLQELANLQKLLSSAETYKMRRELDEEWVYTSEYTHFTFKPLFATGLFTDYIAPLKRRHLFTSATLGPPKLLKRWLGIPTYAELDVDSPFPVENRKVHFLPTAYVTKSNLDTSLQKIAGIINKILKKFADSKGIIHCQSFAIGKQLWELLGGNRRILLHTKNNSRESLLEQHVTSESPTVLMSPSMTEGLDLKGELSRFTVFAKMPYPYLGDAWVTRRKDVDPEWYSWQVAKTLMQGFGRSVRSETDCATGYILDSCFESFWDKNSWLFPQWFKNSIV